MTAETSSATTHGGTVNTIPATDWIAVVTATVTHEEDHGADPWVESAITHFSVAGFGQVEPHVWQAIVALPSGELLLWPAFVERVEAKENWKVDSIKLRRLTEADRILAR